MDIFTHMLTRNDCYISGSPITPCGVMVHSTGANNPRLSRYVDDPRFGRPSPRHWNQSGVGACVHAFIGKTSDGSVETVQTLPWNMMGWHSGSGTLGYAQNANHSGYIGFEICEDDLSDPTYFAAVYREAVELVAYLCRIYHLDPLAPGVVICHSEGHRLGIASNHADVMHWFPRFGESMDTFRAAVAAELRAPEKKEDNEMTEKEIREIVRSELEKISREQAAEPASSWAQPLIDEAAALGITDGSRPMSPCTRQEAIVLALKAAQTGREGE